MDTVPLHLTAPFENRRLATSLVARVSGLPQIAAHSLVLTTDAAATAVLRTAGIPTEDARPILAALWWHPQRPVDSKLVRPRSLDAARAGERLFVRELGQRQRLGGGCRRQMIWRVPARTGHRTISPRCSDSTTVCVKLLMLTYFAKNLSSTAPSRKNPQPTKWLSANRRRTSRPFPKQIGPGTGIR